MHLLDYNSNFSKFINLLSKITFINILWLICSIPVITAGAATAAQHYAISELMNHSDTTFKNFKYGFKKHWKQATLIWIPFLIALALLSVEFLLFQHNNISGKNALMVIISIAFVTVALVLIWINPVLINYKGNVWELIFNAFVFAFMYLPATAAIVALYALSVYISFKSMYIAALFILFGPTLIEFAKLKLFNKFMKKYAEQK